MEPGALAARSHLEGFSYDEAAGDRFDRRREAALFNRLLYECLPAVVVPSLLREGAASSDLRRRLCRHWAPNVLKSGVARAALPRLNRTRLTHRDRACHTTTCDCVWCTCETQQPSTPIDVHPCG